MGKKYIIELEDGEHLYKTTINAFGNPVMRGAEKIPYTEFDLKQVREEEYKDGYEMGVVAGRLKAEKSGQSFYEDGYLRGLTDVWEAVEKIARMDTKTAENITGYFGLFRIMKNLTPMQAIEKLQAYEQKQNEKKKTDYYFEMMKDAIETSAKEYGMSLDEVAAAGSARKVI